MTDLNTGEFRIVREAEYTRVICNDNPGAGGACHSYEIEDVPKEANPPTQHLGGVRFQNGPIQENGVNGVQNEDLLAIVIDRLKGFQSGLFACSENAVALAACKLALSTLEARTADRKARGVEGKNEL